MCVFPIHLNHHLFCTEYIILLFSNLLSHEVKKKPYYGSLDHVIVM